MASLWALRSAVLGRPVLARSVVRWKPELSLSQRAPLACWLGIRASTRHPKKHFSTCKVLNRRRVWPENPALNWNLMVERLRKAGRNPARPWHPETVPNPTLPYLWLRDSCRCSECVNPATMQRNLDTFAIPPDIQPESITFDDRGLAVTWADGHRSHYDWDFLQSNMTYDSRAVELRQPEAYWGAEIAANPPTLTYGEVMQTETGVAKLTAKLRTVGFAFVEETPYDDPDKTRQLLERIGPIRTTHYGGFYDFTPNLAMADTAYTNLALPAHTDTTYFTEPAGLQAFHLLSHQPVPGGGPADQTASGGKSLLVDGFKAAEALLAEDRASWSALVKFRVPWHASGNAGIAIAPDKPYPVLEYRSNNSPHRVRWNNADRGVPVINRSTEMWYNAARKWDEILKRKELEYWFQLEPGKVLIFDNWRVLHGRSAFTGIRRICGGYINRDDFMSRWRNTNFERKQVVNTVMSSNWSS